MNDADMKHMRRIFLTTNRSLFYQKFLLTHTFL